MRENLQKSYDAHVFTKTAERTKILNVSTFIPRGGIRL